MTDKCECSGCQPGTPDTDGAESQRCEECGAADDCCECCQTCHRQYCECCDTCGEAPVDCDCCGECGSRYCSGPCYECGYCDCVCCGECESYPCQCSQGFGSTEVPPWQTRGEYVPNYRVTGQRWQNRWTVDTTIDVCQSAADFYLLEALTGCVVNGTGDMHKSTMLRVLRGEAQDMLDALVTRLDESFTDYVDMAVGGELRYHTCQGGSQHGEPRLERNDAWAEWANVRAAAGTAALTDAAALFIEMADDTCSYGGKPWANAATLLRDRLTGRITPRQWVDRVFTLQHNGGALLNKVNWQVHNVLDWNLNYHMTRVLDAHAGHDPYPVLLAIASPAVAALFREYWRIANKVRREHVMPLGPMPDAMAVIHAHREERRRHGAYVYAY